MAPDLVPPRFLSREFHTRFFPRLLWDRLRRKKREEQETSFPSTMEPMIVFAVCLILAVIGIPSAWAHGSMVGWILSILGVGGVLVIFILSVAAQWGSRPTYDQFLTGIFFFFVSLGILAGIPVGMDAHSPWLGAWVSLAGLFGGYVLGIFAGLQLQCLGWIASILSMLAGLTAIVLGATALVMLLMLTVR